VKICPVGSRVVPGGQPDTMELIVTVHDIANTPKKVHV